MLRERARPAQISPDSVERLADTLFDLARDQDVRVIEALAAGPPYPTPPVEIEMTPPGGPGPVTTAGMQIMNATPPEGLALTAREHG